MWAKKGHKIERLNKTRQINRESEKITKKIKKVRVVKRSEKKCKNKITHRFHCFVNKTTKQKTYDFGYLKSKQKKLAHTTRECQKTDQPKKIHQKKDTQKQDHNRPPKKTKRKKQENNQPNSPQEAPEYNKKTLFFLINFIDLLKEKWYTLNGMAKDHPKSPRGRERGKNMLTREEAKNQLIQERGEARERAEEWLKIRIEAANTAEIEKQEAREKAAKADKKKQEAENDFIRVLKDDNASLQEERDARVAHRNATEETEALWEETREKTAKADDTQEWLKRAEENFEKARQAENTEPTEEEINEFIIQKEKSKARNAAYEKACQERPDADEDSVAGWDLLERARNLLKLFIFADGLEESEGSFYCSPEDIIDTADLLRRAGEEFQRQRDWQNEIEDIVEEATTKAEAEAREKLDNDTSSLLAIKEWIDSKETRAAKRIEELNNMIRFYKEYQEAENAGEDSGDERFEFAKAAQELVKLLIEEKD